MSTWSLLQCLLLLASVLSAIVSVSLGDKGTAAYYKPSSNLTECYGDDSSQFPESGQYVALCQKLFAGKAACGMEYDMWCDIEAQSGPENCIPGAGPVRVKVLDCADSVVSGAAAPGQSVRGDDFVLFETAFKKIAKPFADSIPIIYKEVPKLP